jgi:hypothetical protein
MRAKKLPGRATMDSYRPLAEGYQPRPPGDSFQKEFTADATNPSASVPPRSPPRGGSSAAKPRGKQTG